MNRNNISKVFPQHFSGDVDQLLSHINSVDIDEVDAEVSRNNTICKIMSEFDVDQNIAVNMLNRLEKMMLENTINELVKLGLVEVCGVDANGDPFYKNVDVDLN
jgi:hypothetical protein